MLTVVPPSAKGWNLQFERTTEAGEAKPEGEGGWETKVRGTTLRTEGEREEYCCKLVQCKDGWAGDTDTGPRASGWKDPLLWPELGEQ